MNDLIVPQNMRNLLLGFDDFFDRFEKLRKFAHYQYPHFNLVKEEGGYSIEVALAGFKKEDLAVEHDKKNGVLRISGKVESKSESKRLLAQGIATREFTREFSVADGVEVLSASMDNGILTVKLKEPKPLPEEKPLLITIQ